MFRFTIAVLVLSCALSCVIYSQEPSSNPQTPAPAQPAAQGQSAAAEPAEGATKPTASAVPMSEAVITLKGACQPKPGTTVHPAGCVSSVSRQQFEKLTTALTPPGRPPATMEVKRNFANQYAKLLTFADAARALGMENDPRVLEIYQFAKDQILMEALNQRVTQEYEKPPQQEIDDYYKENSKKYVEVTLERIIIPRNTAAENAKPDQAAAKPKPDEAAEKAYADTIRQRWVAGEDPAKLQKEASEHAGAANGNVNVQLGPRRPGTLPESQSAVFDMKSGEISQPFSDLSGIYIFKVVSSRQIPLSEVQPSIASTLSRQKIVDKIQEIQNGVTPELNEAYFGPPAPPGPPMRPGMIQPRGALPPGGANRPGAANPAGAANPSAPANPPAQNSGTPPPQAQDAPPK